MYRSVDSYESNTWKGLVSGAIAGLAAAWAMTKFQHGISALNPRGSGDGEGKQARGQDEEAGQNETATMRAANMVSEKVMDKPLSREQKESAAPFMHYAFGATMGALYGALAERIPLVTAGGGVPYGLAVWLGADEIAVPALGLGKSPMEAPPSSHAYSFASHVVYGASLDAARRVVRSSLGNQT